MSQDNPVTPMQAEPIFPSEWLSRSLSLAPVTLLRLRHIEKLHGAARRASKHCGCQKESRFPSPAERAVVWGTIQPTEPVRQVLMSTPCRLLPLCWLVLCPNGGAFSWAEVFEIALERTDFFSNDPDMLTLPRTLEEWEHLSGSDLKFRICQSADASLDIARERIRLALVTELMQRNPQYSHINLSLQIDDSESVPRVGALLGQFSDFAVEALRDRYIPEWRQSGDMAYRRFNTYTITRKDI